MRIRLLSLLGAVTLIGCGSTGPDRPDGIPPLQSILYPAAAVPTGFQAAVPDKPGVTAVGVRFTNTGTAPATIEHGACAVAVWLYRDDQPDWPPVWQNGSGEMMCIDVLYRTSIAPGETYDVSGAQFGALQTGLPAGRYVVRVALLRDPGTRVGAELIVLDAGTIALVH